MENKEIVSTKYLELLRRIQNPNLEKDTVRSMLITFKLEHQADMDWTSLQNLQKRIDILNYSVSAEYESQSAGKFTKNVSSDCISYECADELLLQEFRNSIRINNLNNKQS